MTKRISISVTDELDREVQRLKKKQYFDKPYSEVYRMLISKGIECIKEKEGEKHQK